LASLGDHRFAAELEHKREDEKIQTGMSEKELEKMASKKKDCPRRRIQRLRLLARPYPPVLMATRRVRAYVGLGANVGDARENLRLAVLALSALPGVSLHGVSRLYLTKPVGVIDQPDFFNAVVALEVPAGPNPETGALALLAALKSVEQALGRQARQRWGPREVDLDLLLFGRNVIKIGRPDGRWLAVPHVQSHERLFVLAPLSDLAPGLRPPGWGETVSSARRRQESAEGPDAVRVAAGQDWADA
jgi:2-amino-4-hydroxy-6-hydroxymethyldihydropteridine diphosphokinase